MIKRFSLVVALVWPMAAVSNVYAQPLSALAQVADTAASVSTAAIPSLKSLKPAERTFIAIIPPAAMLTYGALSFKVKAIRNIDHSVRADRMQHMATFRTDVDDFMQYTPTAAAFALSFMNVKGKHNFGDRTGILLVTQGLMAGSMFGLKKAAGRLRPNAANSLSFPSGHTANAFAAAEFMRQEYGEQSAWYGIAGYTVATATGVCRVYNNAHWFSDVIAGAGLGILSAKAATYVYPFLKNKVFKKDSGINLAPQIGGGYTGVAFVMQL